MLEYYLPGLDVSTLSDREFTVKIAHLYKIREMEEHSNSAKLFKQLLGNKNE